jgi:hypothetical protein
MRPLTNPLLGLALLIGACQPDRPGQAEPLSVEVRSIQPEAACFRALFRCEERADRTEVVDVSPLGQVLLGEPLPVPSNGTFRLEYRVTLIDEEGAPVPALLPDTLQDARFSPDGRSLAVLDRAGDLSVVELGSGRKAEIDTEVFPGFAFSPDGTLLAYAKGDAPFLDAYLHDLRAGTSRQLTFDQVPTWGFAFSPDQRTLAFVYSPLGFSSLYTLDLSGGAAKPWTNVGVTRDSMRAGRALAPMPDSRKPPLWLSGGLVFEGSGGVHAIGADGAVAWARPGARSVFRASDDEVHYVADGLTWSATLRASP